MNHLLNPLPADDAGYAEADVFVAVVTFENCGDGENFVLVAGDCFGDFADDRAY